MPEIAWLVSALGLLLAAGALVLWQWAVSRQTRQAISRHLAQQIAAAAAPAEPAFDPRRINAAAGVVVDPWTPVAAEAAPAPSRWSLPALPGWLEGAVTLQQLGAVAVVGVAACLVALWAGGAAAAFAVLTLVVTATLFTVWLRVQRFRRGLVRQLPDFIDAMVRLITIGNATHAAFSLAVATASAPLRGYMENASALVRAGVDLDQALRQMARSVRIEEMHLLAAILGLGVRYGGRADTLLERVAAFMRDREQAEDELMAMSAETRLSAWILGLLPIAVGGFIVMTNPSYFTRMWQDSSGQMMIFGAFGLQAIGVFLLYRLARLD